MKTSDRIHRKFCETPEVTLLGMVRSFGIYQCRDCETIFVPDVVESSSDEYLKLYVDDEIYHTHWMQQNHYTPYTDRFDHDFDLGLNRIDKIFPLAGGGPLLDVGCSNGAFLKAVSEFGYSAIGIDANATMVEYVIERGLLAIPVVFPDCDRFADVWHGRFRVLTMHDVFEHIQDPFACLQRASQLLMPGGLLVIDTPCASCDDAMLQGVAWKHVKPEEHPWLFGESALLNMLAQTGFNVVKKDCPIPGKIVMYGYNTRSTNLIRKEG